MGLGNKLRTRRSELDTLQKVVAEAEGRIMGLSK